MTQQGFVEKMTHYFTLNIPFFFLVDFEKHNPIVLPIIQARKENILFEIEGYKNFDYKRLLNHKKIEFKSYPIDFEVYKKGFEIVKENILYGNTYLLNLTYPTRIETNYSLIEIFHKVNSPYKLFFKNAFVLFSPECFIKIKDNKVFTYPMKGTIDASIPMAEEIIINNKKELFEHFTVVDLLRNDLAIIAENIQVKRFRYIEKIKTHKGEILQVSSEIQGELKDNWKQNFAQKFFDILPAGSISGAPKNKTVEIIRKAEIDKRGYYTGVFGIYFNNILISAVNIRYIEKKKTGLYFHSGGGITAFSNVEDEYKELIQKVYVPIR